jgi:hypothetical protein
MSRAMLWLSGADDDVLRHCERERSKFVAMGGTVLTTGVLAALSATLTAHDFLHMPIWAAVAVGLSWGAAIMNLDRWLLITIRRQETVRRTILMALPRVVLAVLIGLAISEPLVLRIFDSEVTAQAKENQRLEYKEGLAEVRGRYRAISGLKQEERQIEENLTAVGSGADLLALPEYRHAQEAVRALEQRAASQSGADAQAIEAEVDAERQRAASIRTQAVARESATAKQSRRFERRRLRTIQAELRRLRRRRESGVADLDSSYGSVGLLDRVEALGDLTSEHPTMLWVRILLSLLILMVDALPAIAKVLMSIGKESLYEKTQNRLEKFDGVALEHQIEAYSKSSEVEASLIVDEAMTRKAFVKEAQDDLIKQAVEAMREAGERFVAGWGRAVIDSADDLVDAELKRSGLYAKGRNGESQGNGQGP